MTIDTKPYFQEQIQKRLEEVITEAKLLGLVIGIEIKSSHPPSMGSVEMIPSVRDARHLVYIDGEHVQKLVQDNLKTIRAYKYGNNYLMGNVIDEELTFYGLINEDQYICYVKDNVCVN